MIISQDEFDDLMFVAEKLLTDARVAIIESVASSNSDIKAISLACAEVYVRQANLIRKLCKSAGYNSGSEYEIVGFKVLPKKT